MIELHQLRKTYGATVAVDDLTFSVRPGVVTGFLGPNGAGKSTTMRMILGLDRPTSGTALIDGRPFDRYRAPLRTAGALLDSGQIHPRRTAYAHLLSLAATIGEGSARVREVLDLVGLAEVGHRRVGGLSLGMRQRLGIAAALLGDPGVLLLDEPVNGLDPQGVLWVRGFLRRLADQGRTVFVSSHLLSEMAQTADHLVVIGRGRLMADVPTRDLLTTTRPHLLVRSPQARELAGRLQLAGALVERDPAQPGAGRQGPEALRVENIEAADVARLALRDGIEIHELTPTTRSLEEAFLELTGATVEFRGSDTTAPLGADPSVSVEAPVEPSVAVEAVAS